MSIAGHPLGCRDVVSPVGRATEVLPQDYASGSKISSGTTTSQLLALQPGVELGLGGVAAPDHDGMDGGADAPHPGRRLECTCQTPHHRCGSIQQLPSPARIHPDLDRIPGCQRGDGAMHGVTDVVAPCEAQIDLVQTRPPVSAEKLRGILRSYRRQGDGRALQDRGDVRNGLMERVPLRQVRGRRRFADRVRPRGMGLHIAVRHHEAREGQGLPGAGHGHVIEPARGVQVFVLVDAVPASIEHRHVIELQSLGAVCGR